MATMSNHSKEEIHHIEHNDGSEKKAYSDENGQHVEARAENGVIDIDEGFDPAVVKRTMRKIDLRLIPILTFMYLVSITGDCDPLLD